MNKKYPSIFTIFFVLLASAWAAQAQTVSFQFNYLLDARNADEPPVLKGFPDVNYPDAARKNGVEGKLKITCKINESGLLTDIVVTGEGLPFGVTEAVLDSLKKFKATPAKSDGKPVPVSLEIDYVVALAFAEGDPNVKKAVPLTKPVAVYPESQRAEKFKGKVSVQVLVKADGTTQVLSVGSNLPKEFDRAAFEAAKDLKFQPATHKKSKKPVSQSITVEFDFKP